MNPKMIDITFNYRLICEDEAKQHKKSTFQTYYDIKQFEIMNHRLEQLVCQAKKKHTQIFSHWNTVKRCGPLWTYKMSTFFTQSKLYNKINIFPSINSTSNS